VNISVNGERPGSIGYGAADIAGPASALTPSGSGLSPANGGVASEDRLSVSPATLRVTTTLSALSASQTSRVSRLQSLYASGRYDAGASKTAQAIVSGALTNSALNNNEL